MSARPIILFALTDSARADRLADVMEAEGRFLPTLDAVTEGIDISDGRGRRSAYLRGVPGDGLPRSPGRTTRGRSRRAGGGRYRVSTTTRTRQPIEIEGEPFR